jgi:alpha-galactosidase
VLAVDQDRLGVQGTMIAQRGPAQVWAKPLAGGEVAVALLNRGAQPVSIATTASRVGLGAARSYRVRDLWADRTTTSPGDIGALVAPDSVVLYRVAPVRRRP